jgi:hypothetical protein
MSADSEVNISRNLAEYPEYCSIAGDIERKLMDVIW